ncbi:TIR domain-containing protein [Nitrosomonas sp.]|uniref:TIR domain-containing protein n=1 Tax=Nitrosomonas sp. TaxID=42353 RepID=UPI00261EE588|nr:TIR domain-containing protein [Nitrosomonas sp.]
MTYVFLSYARADGRCWAERIDADLQQAGIGTFRDTRNIDPDQDFTGKIEEGIRAASHVIVCLTKDVERGESFVRREIQYALNQDQRRREQNPPGKLWLVPVVFPGGDLPVHICTRNVLSLSIESEYDQLLSTILDRLKNPATDDELPVYGDTPEIVRYLQNLHEWCSQRLAETVMHLLNLETKDVHDATMPAPANTNTFRIGFSVSPAVDNRNSATQATSKPEKVFASFKDAFRAHHKRILLLGAPGAGKTTALLAFTRDAAVSRLHNPSEHLPVLASIASWDLHLPILDWVERVSPWPKLRNEQPLLLLDGLDELGSPRTIYPDDTKIYDPRALFLDALARDLPTGPVVITSRETDYREISHIAPLDATLTLQPLSDAQIQDYLTARNQTFLWDRVSRDPEFALLVRTPLLLGMLSLAIGQDLALGQSDAPFDEAFVFDRYISRRFVHEASKAGTLPFKEQDARTFLASIAATMWLEEPGGFVSSFRWMRPTQRTSLAAGEARYQISMAHAWILNTQHTSLAADEMHGLSGVEVERFLEFGALMHLLRKDKDGEIAFRHLKLRDFCALPALFEFAHRPKDSEMNSRQNELGFGFVAMSSEQSKWIARTATEALRLISRGGIDLVTAARRLKDASQLAMISERRLRFSSSPELFIPDNTRTWTRDTIDVPDTGFLVDISINLKLDHTYVGDLVIRLHAPGSPPIVLENRQGSSGKSARTPFTSVLDPGLAALRGMNCQGKWILEVIDKAEADNGVLHSWALDFHLHA